MTTRSFRWLPLLALTVTLMAGSTSFAGPKKNAGAGGKKGDKAAPMAKMLEQLNLTEVQKVQLKPVLEEAAAQRKALMADTTLTPAQKKAKMKENRASIKEKMDAILTPEQEQKLKDLRKAQAHKGKKDDDAKKAA